jgi:hypothetical protein
MLPNFEDVIQRDDFVGSGTEELRCESGDSRTN